MIDDIAHYEGGLSEEQGMILTALLTHPTKTAAAKALNMPRSTLYHRLKVDWELKEAYEQMRAAAIADATDSLLGVSESAVAVLHSLAHDIDTPPSVRVTAATKLIEFAMRAHEATEIIQRIEALESA